MTLKYFSKEVLLLTASFYNRILTYSFFLRSTCCVDLNFNFEKYHSMTFSRKWSSILLVVLFFNELISPMTISLFLTPHQCYGWEDTQDFRLLKYYLIHLPTYLHIIYFYFVWFVLEYGIIVWQPYFSCDQIRIAFFFFAEFLLKIDHLLYNYTPIHTSFNILLFASSRVIWNLFPSFSFSIISSMHSIASFSLRIPTHFTRNRSLFSISTHLTTYGHNHSTECFATLTQISSGSLNVCLHPHCCSVTIIHRNVL